MVEAPKYASSGTSISPMESRSILVFIVVTGAAPLM